jgi:hypothetical protein
MLPKVFVTSSQIAPRRRTAADVASGNAPLTTVADSAGARRDFWNHKQGSNPFSKPVISSWRMSEIASPNVDPYHFR